MTYDYSRIDFEAPAPGQSVKAFLGRRAEPLRLLTASVTLLVVLFILGVAALPE